MDPLSVIAGVIAVLGAVGSTATAVEKLWALKDASGDLASFLNEISNFRLLLIVIRDMLQSLEVGQWQNNQDIILVIRNETVQANQIFSKINTVVCDIVRPGDQTSSSAGLSVSRLAYARRGKELRGHRRSLENVKRNLTAALTSLNTLLHIESSSEIVLAINNIVTTNQSQQHRTVEVMESHVQTMCRNVERILSYAQQPGTLLGPLGEKEASRNKNHAVGAKCHTENGESLKSAPFQDNAFKVETAVFHQRCATQCRCQCHRVTRLQTPPWLKDIFGGLFITTRGIRLIPYPRRETCNESSCYRHSNTVTRIDYYFPCWLMACMISIVGQGHALIGAGATLSLKASRMVPDYSPIFFAVDHANHKSIAHMVYSGSATLFDMDQYGDSLLWYASRSHNWQTCTMLTQAGLSWSSTNLSGLSPAHEAWMQLYMLESETPETEHMKMVLKRDDSYDHLKLPALHSVVLKQTGKVDLDDYLQVNRSEINIRDEWGNTPLTWAAQRHDERAVRLLLKWGADPNVNDMKGNSALQIAAFNGPFESVKRLLQANANIHNRNNWKNTPLHRAAKSAESCTDIIELLLEKGVENQDSGNEWGHTPLHEAAVSGHAENVRILCSRNFNVNARSADGQTPIFKAMLQNKIEVVRILISAGAYLDILDKSGRHLIEQACLFGTLELLKFVLPAIISSMDPSTAEEYKQKWWRCIEKDRDHTCFVDRCKVEELAALKSLFLDKDPLGGEDDLAQSFYADALETLP